jgi:type II secretory pathway pseudopilin PulG
MTQRNGTSLVEVLVAIFIMGVGLLSLLTLFPVGAMSMAQATKDDRAATVAANAFALAEARNLRHDYWVKFLFDRTGDRRNPGQLIPLRGKNIELPSYPIYIDPIGSAATGNPPSDTIAGIFPGIVRTNVSFVEKSQMPPPRISLKDAVRWFSLLDDLTYLDPATNPQYGVPTSDPSVDDVQRENRYSWAYMVQRPRYLDPTVVNMSVIVYSNRKQTVPLEPFYAVNAAFDPKNILLNGPNIVTIDMPNPKPDLRKGMWILDATVHAPSPTGDFPEPHGHFYRIVNFTETPTSLLLELSEAPKASTVLPNGTRYGVLVLMENVIEVFEKGPGWQP